MNEKECDRLAEFVNQMFKTYDKTEMLREICIIKKFNNQKTEFFQIAKRVKLPKNFFRDNVDNRMVAGDFSNAITTGERDFVLKHILEEAKKRPEVVLKLIAENFEYHDFANILSKINNPTDIFIPIKPYFKAFFKWVYGDKRHAEFEDPGKEGIGREFILYGNKRIQIHWLTSSSNIKDIIITDKNKIEIIQKMFEQSDNPKDINPLPEFNHYSKGKELMLYFGDKNTDNYDFVFRSVISKPEIVEGSAIIIDVRNKPGEDD